jgi:hypothetical protein
MAQPDPALRLSAQRALLGAVGPGVLGVSVGLEGDRLAFDGFVAPDASEEEREALDMAASEMLADFPAVSHLDLDIAEVPDMALPARGREWVFVRLGARIGPPR